MINLLSVNTDLSIKPVSLFSSNKENVLKYFENTWDIYETLFSAINDEKTYFESPDPLRNPLIFYYGHSAAFYVNKFRIAGIISEGINEHYEELFAKGVDPNLPENLEVIDLWPSLEGVIEYRQKVLQLVKDVIDSADYTKAINDEHPLWSLMMGIEHDRIHFETSSVLIRQVNVNLLTRPKDWHYAPSFGNPKLNEWRSVKGGSVQLGKPSDSNIFGWDNEYGKRQIDIKSFNATKNLVSNHEYLEFYNLAYQKKEFWTTEGWNWKTENEVQHPKFWIKRNEEFLYRAMFDEILMPLDWPVEVNAHEAQAYCNWIGNGTRLLTEGEFNLIAKPHAVKEPYESEGVNVNMRFGSPSPVGYFEDESIPAEFNDLFGNVWDWLSDDFYPLKGFKAHEYYLDFSEPYFDSEHSMLLGGSWSSTGTSASKDYRLWFRRNFYQHAGFRLAKDE